MILEAAWVIPVSSPAIRGGYVELAGARIAAVGSSARLGPARKRSIDLGDTILTPGLINPHTHLELSCYAGKLQPAPFWDWIQKLVQLRAAPGQLDREQQAVGDGAWRSLRAGVTCVGDISRRNCAWLVLKSIPIRKVCFVELLTLADHAPRNPEELRAGTLSVKEDGLLTAGISPHAPYTVPVEQIRSAIALADELRRPWTMHFAETLEEVAFLHGRPAAFGPMIERLLRQCGVQSPRKSPVELLAECSGGLRRGSLAHANHVEDAEIGRLARLGHTVIYCPRSHHFFRHPPHPFVRMRAAGVPVAIGTDSLASNASLSVLDELHHVFSHTPEPPSPGELFSMVTLEAARALELDARIGSLETGRQADLAAFPCSPETADPVRELIENPRPADAVWVAGRRVL